MSVFAGQAFECCDLRLVLLKKISRLGIFIERPSLKLPNPDPDQSARDVMELGQSVRRFVRNKFLGDLSF